MEATNQPYVVEDGDGRIREILDNTGSFEDAKDIPSFDQLTYSNGYYVNAAALFIDIRGSSKLPEKHKRPILGKIYRSYLSECVAMINSNSNCREIFINGDCVSGILSAKSKSDLDDAFSTAAQLNSLIKILNWRLEQRGYETICCGIGLDYGRALMMKAGYKGSGINEIIWMGEVVNGASNLCHQGNRWMSKAIQVSKDVYQNLNDHNKNLLSPVLVNNNIFHISHYQGDIINTTMNDWLNEQKNKARLAQASAFRGGLNGLLRF